LNPLEFIKLTPKTNCGKCNHPTCLAFAVAVTKGGADPAACPYVIPGALPSELKKGPAGGGGLESVRKGQDARDMALVIQLRSKIHAVDFGKVAPLLGVHWNPEFPDRIDFMYLGRKVELGKDSLLMNGGIPVDPRDQILLYNYIALGGGDVPLSDWVGMESLPNSISKVRTLSTYCEQPLAGHFTGRAQSLAKICRRLGADPVHNAPGTDVAVVIPVLPRVPHCLLFWDEEPEDGFASRVKILFDRKVLDFLDIESLVFSAERMAERIMELDS